MGSLFSRRHLFSAIHVNSLPSLFPSASSPSVFTFSYSIFHYLSSIPSMVPASLHPSVIRTVSPSIPHVVTFISPVIFTIGSHFIFSIFRANKLIQSLPLVILSTFPSFQPSDIPSRLPSLLPSRTPSSLKSLIPSIVPSLVPSNLLSVTLTVSTSLLSRRHLFSAIHINSLPFLFPSSSPSVFTFGYSIYNSI